MADHILYEVEDGIATITIDRPEKKNAMTYAMLGNFIEVIRRAGAHRKTRVVILTGVPQTHHRRHRLRGFAGGAGSAAERGP